MRWINSKLSTVLNATLQSTYAMIAITETGIGSSVEDSEFMNVDKYAVFRCDRDFITSERSRGGGVCLAIDWALNPINLNVKSSSEFNNLFLIDVVGAKVRLNLVTYYVFVIYIPPDISLEMYNSIFDIFSSLNVMFSGNILIIGDFNIPEYINFLNVAEQSSAVLRLNNFCQFLSFNQFNLIRNTHGRILDLVLANFNCDVLCAPENFVPLDPHHPPLHIHFKASLNSLSNKYKTNNEFYNFKRSDLVSLYQSIGATDWSFLNEYKDIDDAFEAFYSELYSLLNQYVPVVKASCRKYPPWFNSDLIKCIRKKFKLFEKYKSTNSPLLLDEFRRLRSYIKAESERRYNSYCESISEDIKENPSRFWKFINRKKNGSTLPNNFEYNGNEYSNPLEISEAFARYFSNSYTNANNSLQSVDNSNSPQDDPRNNSSCPTLSCKNFSITDIEKALKRIKPKNTMGPDRIPAFLVHDCASVLAAPLTYLYNLSFQNSIFPNVLKCSRIVPIHKKGNINLIENFRPITIINNFSKALEIALHLPIYNHVRNMVTENQHGFMKKRSTTTNLFCITQFIANSLDNHSQVDVIYTDLSKAFDKLDHQILLLKLDRFGFDQDLCNYLRSYLTNRLQYVDFNGFKSRKFLATSGVPQGSILGPLFFNVYINDIGDNLVVQHLLYADDLKIFTVVNDSSDCLSLQAALSEVHKWCSANHLCLNVSKCNVVSFSLKHANNIVKYDYTINEVPVPRSTSFRDLGVVFDEKLSFVTHIQDLTNRCFRSLGFILRNSKDFIDISLCILLYKTFVRSKLEYASIAWSPYYAVHIDALERIQRRFLKYLAFRKDGVYPAIGFPHDVLCERFTIEPLMRRRRMFDILFVFKTIHNLYDCPSILEMLDFHIPRVNARIHDIFYLCPSDTNIHKYSPLMRMCTHLNSICNELDIFSCSIANLKSM